MDKEFEQRVQQISINALIDIALGCERLQLFTAKIPRIGLRFPNRSDSPGEKTGASQKGGYSQKDSEN